MVEKTEMTEIEPKRSVDALCSETNNEQEKEKPRVEGEEKPTEKEVKIEEEEVTVPAVEEEDVTVPAVKEEDVPVELEPRTGISFPVMVAGKQLNSVGLRKKSVLGLGIKIYGFGTLEPPASVQ